MGGTQDTGFHTDTPGGLGRLCVLFLHLSFPGIRMRRNAGCPHSLEGTSVAEVWFLEGAGTLVCPFPCTELTQLGEYLPVRTGDTAAGEDLGHFCCGCLTET